MRFPWQRKTSLYSAHIPLYTFPRYHSRNPLLRLLPSLPPRKTIVRVVAILVGLAAILLLIWGGSVLFHENIFGIDKNATPFGPGVPFSTTFQLINTLEEAVIVCPVVTVTHRNRIPSEESTPSYARSPTVLAVDKQLSLPVRVDFSERTLPGDRNVVLTAYYTQATNTEALTSGEDCPDDEVLADEWQIIKRMTVTFTIEP